MVSDTVVEEVRARADLVEICGEHVTLKRVGKSYRGPCPLHGGEGPNFSVDAARGIYKCFVCGEGGDVFGFVMQLLGLDFPEAVRYVGARVGIDVPDRSEPREDPHAHLREVVAFADEWFTDQLGGKAGGAARSHLESRGIDLDVARQYGIGYAPDEWRALREAASARGVEESLLLELGLLATSERAEEPYDRFRRRLMFSIRDLRDRAIGFGGRDLGPSSDDVPKYINSPDSPIFHKGETLYGLGWARHAIRREGYAAIVEGYTDVLALHLHQLPIAVAGLGTAFTPQQARQLARYTKQAYLLYDSDDAGLRATFRTADVLLQAGVHPLVVTLPRDEDPDSVVRSQGEEAVRGYLSDAVDVLERKLLILEREGYLSSIEGRRRAVDGLLSTLRAVRDPALRDIYLDRAAERTGVRRDTLVHEIARTEAQRGRARGSVAGGPRVDPAGSLKAPEDDPRSHLAERNLVLLLLRDQALIGRASEAGVGPEHLEHAGLRRVYQALLEHDESGGDMEWAARLEPNDRELAERLIGDATELTEPVEIFEQSMRRLLYRPHMKRMKEIDRELELADETQSRELLREKQRLANELRAAGVPLSFLRRRVGG
jgi:DNA primase